MLSIVAITPGNFRSVSPAASLLPARLPVKPDLLVLDEPFVSLDAALAARMRTELIELVSRQPVTTLLVTHSIEEAIGIADRIVLLSASPSRLLADWRIQYPRSFRTEEEIVAIRNEIAHKIRRRRSTGGKLLTQKPGQSATGGISNLPTRMVMVA